MAGARLSPKRLRKVLDQIIRMLEPDRQPQQTLRCAWILAGNRSAMLYQTLDAPRLVARMKMRTFAATAIAAAAPPLTSNDSIPPNALICRAASA
jgi:hypothetical protein